MSKEFIDYLARLSPEGETILFVKQKPILKDRQMQYHNDGAIKCTWPAYLPEQYTGKGAWYANTASFILDRFKSGRPSASRDCCEFVLFLVLDDIGTKSNAPPLEPTWKIETSPGNFQWGYGFGEQPTKGDFAAAIKAIAKAGYTDSGAINAVRNVRLPGSINLKPGRGEFAAVLTEFHPEREFTLEGICASLGVTPDEADTADWLPIDLKDDGTDEVVVWLNTQGLVLERPNSSGWMGVICPNHAEHSDGNPMGRYHPVNRAYCCLHAHCEDWGSKLFLGWVDAQGGPNVMYGVRDELIAKKMASAMEKLENLKSNATQGVPQSMFDEANEAKARIAEIEMQELGRVEKAEWYERFAYVEENNAYFDLKTRREVSRAAFDALYRGIKCNSVHKNSNGGSPKVLPSVAYDENRQAQGGKVVVNVTYAPGESALVGRDCLIYGNKWINARPVCEAGNVQPWLDHLSALIPNESERKHILDVLAYKVQYPDRKINHAILMAGLPGAGKDTFFAPFFYAIGGTSHKNVAVSSSKTLESQFNYDIENEVIVVNELQPSDFGDRRALENTLKPIIAAPPEFLSINRKGAHPYQAVNRALVIAFSNFRDAIALPSDDRRWFVVWAEGAKRDCSAILKWYAAGGKAAVAGWLALRDVSTFDHGACPPWTEAKAMLITQSRSSAEEYVVHCIEHNIGPFAAGVIASPFYKVCDQLQGSAPERAKITQNVLLHALNECKWADLGNCHTRELPTKKRLFCRPDLVELGRPELRRMVEEPPPAKHLTAVK